MKAIDSSKYVPSSKGKSEKTKQLLKKRGGGEEGEGQNERHPSKTDSHIH